MNQQQTNLAAVKPRIQFIDLKAQQACIRPQLDAAIKKVLDHGLYIMGPEIHELEKKLAEFCGVKHAISCANGTDALALGLMAKEVHAGHAIFVPSFTFAATAEVVAWMGATPVFIDVLPDTYNMDPKSLALGVQTAKDLGLKPYGVIPVDMFGQPADYDAIQLIADQHNLWVMADAAQSFGAQYKAKKVGNIGDMATTSFFPAKPLGCYGDGGAIFTNDDELAAVIKSLRLHGQGSHKYEYVRVGMNGRLDTLQAAILIEKLKIFPAEIDARQAVANYYSAVLSAVVKTPNVIEQATSVWAQYTIQLPKQINRMALATALDNAGVPTAIYYPHPLHQQKAYAQYPVAGQTNLPVCEALANHVISLPMSGYIDEATLDYVSSQFLTCLANG